MAIIVAVVTCDYFCLTNGNVFISHLYDGSPTNHHYYYHSGWNVQAVIAYIVGIALPFPGFGANVGQTAQDLCHLSWLLSFVTSFVVYYVLCRIWPMQNQSLVRKMGLGCEEMSIQELVAADGTVITDAQDGHPDVALKIQHDKRSFNSAIGKKQSTYVT